MQKNYKKIIIIFFILEIKNIPQNKQSLKWPGVALVNVEAPFVWGFHNLFQVPSMSLFIPFFYDCLTILFLVILHFKKKVFGWTPLCCFFSFTFFCKCRWWCWGHLATPNIVASIISTMISNEFHLLSSCTFSLWFCLLV